MQKVDDNGRLGRKPRTLHEGECVAFAWAIPEEVLVAEDDVTAGLAAAQLARTLEGTAAEQAKAEGGLKSWD